MCVEKKQYPVEKRKEKETIRIKKNKVSKKEIRENIFKKIKIILRVRRVLKPLKGSN